MSEHYCKEVREELKEAIGKFEVALEKQRELLHAVDMKVCTLINRQEPPCEAMRVEIDKLKKDASFLHGSWTGIVAILASLLALGNIGLGLWRK